MNYNKGKQMKKIIVSALAVASIGTSLNAAGCAGLTCDGVTITEVVATSWGSITVNTSGDETALSCTPFANVYLYAASAAAGKNAIYSALLTAQTTQKQVRIDLSADSAGHCQIAYISVK